MHAANKNEICMQIVTALVFCFVRGRGKIPRSFTQRLVTCQILTDSILLFSELVFEQKSVW